MECAELCHHKVCSIIGHLCSEMNCSKNVKHHRLIGNIVSENSKRAHIPVMYSR
jgi:hypothetical protein